MCTNLSPIMNTNRNETSSEENAQRSKHARMHLNFCLELYKLQHEAGMYLLHEHPQGVTSWKEIGVFRSVGFRGVIQTSARTCRYAMERQDANGVGLTMDPSSSLTNSPSVAEELCKKRTGNHRNMVLQVGERTWAAQVYLAEWMHEGSSLQ